MNSCVLNPSQIMDYLMIVMIAIVFVIAIIGFTISYFDSRKEKRECDERLRAAEKRLGDSH